MGQYKLSKKDEQAICVEITLLMGKDGFKHNSHIKPLYCDSCLFLKGTHTLIGYGSMRGNPFVLCGECYANAPDKERILEIQKRHGLDKESRGAVQ